MSESASSGETSRRVFLQRSGLLLGFVVAGQTRWLSPAEARARALPHRVLNAHQVRLLETIGEALVPGAKAAGIAHYIDAQLAAPADESLLMLKYLGVPPTGFMVFYREALNNADRLARARFGKYWPALQPADHTQLLGIMAGDGDADWQGPPASFAFFVLRADACDVVYGTPKGIEKLGLPYMAHITPETDW